MSVLKLAILCAPNAANAPEAVVAPVPPFKILIGPVIFESVIAPSAIFSVVIEPVPKEVAVIAPEANLS